MGREGRAGAIGVARVDQIDNPLGREFVARPHSWRRFSNSLFGLQHCGGQQRVKFFQAPRRAEKAVLVICQEIARSSGQQLDDRPSRRSGVDARSRCATQDHVGSVQQSFQRRIHERNRQVREFCQASF